MLITPLCFTTSGGEYQMRLLHILLWCAFTGMNIKSDISTWLNSNDWGSLFRCGVCQGCQLCVGEIRRNAARHWPEVRLNNSEKERDVSCFISLISETRTRECAWINFDRFLFQKGKQLINTASLFYMKSLHWGGLWFNPLRLCVRHQVSEMHSQHVNRHGIRISDLFRTMLI